MQISLADLKNLWKGVTDWVTGTSASKPAVRATDLETLIGEVAADPTANTLLERLKQIQGKDFATETTLAALKALLNDGSAKVTLNGTTMEMFGATVANRPAASAVEVGTFFMAVDTGNIWQSDGTDWVVR